MLPFQIVDSKYFSQATLSTGPSGHQLRNPVVRDLDGDGAPEVLLTLAQYPDQPPEPVIILGTSPTLSLDTQKFFPAGAPKIRNSLQTVFGDINGDGLQDIFIADSGLDHPPWTGYGFGIGLNRGRGVYDDVSSLVPAEFQVRSDSLAIADLDGDGRAEILPSDPNSTNPGILRWNGSGFTAQRDLIDARLLAAPTKLKAAAWLGFADLDGDGRQDWIVGGGDWQPSARIVFGSAAGFTTQTLVQLPDGPFGHNASPPSAATPITQGANVDHIVVADFNNDGRPDLFALEEQVIHVAPGAITDTNVPGFADLLKNGGTYYGDVAFQVLINNGARQFAEVGAASSTHNLGKVVYFSLSTTDVNNDGFLDLVGIYVSKVYAGDPGPDWGTTFFLNDGTGVFQVLDGSQVLPLSTTNPPGDKRWNLGSFVPTSVAPDRIEGVAIEPIDSPGTTALNVYKLAANRTIGTGPNFADSASLEVPGFNEFYYLNQHPDVAAAVERGEYRSGLEHYLVAGRANGYAMHAPNARVNGHLQHRP